MTTKRRREEEEEDREIETLAMANCLLLLNHINQTTTSTTSSLDRVFKCKTCGRKFWSVQALGGHRASHKRPKLISSLPSSPIMNKAKTHECSICGMEFEMGQALGGHMWRHREDMMNKEHINMGVVPVPLPVLKRSDSKRVNLWLDLNLTPYENDLKLGYQIMAPLFTPFF